MLQHQTVVGTDFANFILWMEVLPLNPSLLINLLETFSKGIIGNFTTGTCLLS